jgi:branched-chain amino acid transport system ATP-binding protein
VSQMSTGYRGVAVVRQLDLRVEEGEVVALLGPNGAGKTSTLLAISALGELIAGDVKVLGRSIRGRRPHLVARDGLAHVPEDRGLFFHLTVGEHLRLGAGRRSNTIEKALAFFPALSPLMDRRAGLLSGGEQQMLALAQALAGNPKLIIVDELSLGLAPILVARLLPVLRQIATSTGAGVLLVEQHVHLALEVADRAYVLNHGRLALAEDAATLRAEPERLTASYLAGAGDSTAHVRCRW